MWKKDTLVYTLPAFLMDLILGQWSVALVKKKTQELAVMVDTFKPLKLTKAAMNLDDGKYYKSWIE